jgi:hypothetical protein
MGRGAHAKGSRGPRHSAAATGLGTLARRGWFLASIGLIALLCAVVALLLIAAAVNGLARWNAARQGTPATSESASVADGRGNVLVIGVKDGVATGFLAMRVDAEKDRVVGVAIPAGTFLQVPGSGFSRIGDGYYDDEAGFARVRLAVSNYLSVPFESHVVVSGDVYTRAVAGQTVEGLVEDALTSSFSADELEALSKQLGALPAENTVFVPLPVSAIKLGDETYLEPEIIEIADLMRAWWGVDATDSATTTRVIVYNGSGTPGIAGEAAKELIAAGFRVVDTKNADNFDYATTQVIVQSGEVSEGDDVAEVLGTGEVKQQAANQSVAEIIVIIGKDYSAPVQ